VTAHATLRAAVAVVITGLWTVSFIVSLFVDGYTTPPAVNSALMVVLGWLFVIDRRNGAKANGASGAT